MTKDSAFSTLSGCMGESGSEILRHLCLRSMEMLQELLEETHLQVAPSLLDPAQVALALPIPVPEMTFPNYHHQEERFIETEEEIECLRQDDSTCSSR